MKRVLSVALLLATIQAGAQDRLTRIGGYSTGGSTARDPADDFVEVTERTPVPVSVSQITGKEIQRLFQEQVAVMYGMTENGTISQKHQYRYFRGGEWRYDSLFKARFGYRTSQHLGGTRHLMTDENYRGTFVVDLDRQYADNTFLKLRLEDTGQLYTYISVLGAKNTVRVMQVAYEPDLIPLPYKDFVAAVKDGMTFDVLRECPLDCPTCNGTGFVKKNDRSGRLAVRSFCPTCKGKKTIIRKLLCRLHLPKSSD